MALSLNFFVGCGDETPSSSVKKEKLAPTEDLLAYDRYSPESYLKPFWYTREVYNETLMFVGDNDEAKLLYEADEILSVTDYGLKKAYAEGVDWTYENGVFRRTKIQRFRSGQSTNIIALRRTRIISVWIKAKFR